MAEKKKSRRTTKKPVGRQNSKDVMHKLDPRLAGLVSSEKKEVLASGSWTSANSSGSWISPMTSGSWLGTMTSGSWLGTMSSGSLIVPLSLDRLPIGALSLAEQVSPAAINKLAKEELTTVFVETSNPDEVRQKVRTWGGKVKGSTKDTVICEVQRATIRKLAEHDAVSYIEAPALLKPACDQAHISANLVVDNAKKSRKKAPTRTVAETGKGVLIGIIDTGIDVTHPGFLVNGRSRIVDYLDQTTTPETHYEATHTKGYLDLKKMVRDSKSPDENGHGTHVAGVAAGNGAGSPNNIYQGVAPEADLAIVKTTFDSTDIALAIIHIFEVAAQRNQPCVINLSLGGHYGAHDGTSLIERIIDDLCSRPGRIVVVSAGNEGQSRIHAMADLSAEPNGRWVADMEIMSRISNGSLIGSTLLQVWTHGEDDLEIMLRGPNGNQFPAPKENGRMEDRHAEFVVEATHQISRYNGDHSVSFNIHTLPFTQLLEGWSLIVEGKEEERTAKTGSEKAERKKAQVGRVHAWIMDGTGRFNNGYSRSHLVGMPGTAFSAITVASYATRNTWRSRDSELLQVKLEAVKHEDISYFSSPGPTRDQHNKPEVAAPGQYLISALSQDAADKLPKWLQIAGRTPYVAMQGTSMAAPYVTGAIALLLEKERGLNWAEVKRRLMKSVKQDGFTTPTWNERWGYGKLDIERLLNIAS